MQLVTIFVEYFVIGATSLAWLLPIWNSYDLPAPPVGQEQVALWIPVLYVLGMLVDYLSYLLLQWLKPVIRGQNSFRLVLRRISGLDRFKRWRTAEGISPTEVVGPPFATRAAELDRKVGSLRGDLRATTAYILHHSPELGRTLQAYSSRDRIARGAFLNSSITACTLLFGVIPANGRATTLLILLSCLLFAMWWRLQFLTYDFLEKAVQALDLSKR